MLPTRLSTSYAPYAYTPLATSSSAPIQEYIYRLTNREQMDFQFAATQLADLLRSPQEVYKTTSIRHSIKSQWSRDDPAVLLLILIFAVASTAAYTLAFGERISIATAVGMIIIWPIVSLIGVGAIVAAIAHTYASTLRTVRLHTTEQTIEYFYAFDVHLNAFFPAFVILSPVHFLLLPIIWSPTLFATILSATLHLAAVTIYLYVTFLGYSALPFIEHAERMLYPVLPAALIWLILITFNINVSMIWLGFMYKYY